MPAAISTATTTPKAHALSSALPLGGNTIIRLVAIQIHITTPLSASRSRLTRKGDHHHASSITAKAVLAQAYARGYYNTVVPDLSKTNLPLQAGAYALPPASLRYAIQTFPLAMRATFSTVSNATINSNLPSLLVSWYNHRRRETSDEGQTHIQRFTLQRHLQQQAPPATNL